MAAGSLRLFFALRPTASARQSLRGLQREPGAAVGRRVHPEDLHLTLAFLGQVEAAQLSCVESAADDVVAESVPVSLGRLEYWKGPRVAVAAGEPGPALTALVGQLWDGLARCGFTPEARPFRPHVTLARKVPFFERSALVEPAGWLATEFVLVSSLSVPEPPRYRVLRAWPLKQIRNPG